MLTLLQISDLHRTSDPRIGNDELFAALASDRTRWEIEGIPNPDLIVVSGDLIQGVAIGSNTADEEIAAQYEEVEELLIWLANEFLHSDRSRIVIVPGNHDVNWDRAFRAMKPIDDCSENVATKAWQANSHIRWNWKDYRAYEVHDTALYQSRFDLFRNFRNRFYGELESSPISHECEDLFFMEYEDLGLAVAGFSSWHGNDCFCHIGEISRSALALSRGYLATSSARVAIAVWHHSIVGGPRENDYMDKRIVHRLIDYGFNVGLHGHQHFPDAAPFELRLPNLTSMVIVGAGSIAVGDRDLPMGEHRQFNVVVINPDKNSITVHVRAMSPAGVFTGSHRDDFGGNPYISLDLPPILNRVKDPTDLQKLDQAMTALGKENYQEALDITANISACFDDKKRQIEIKALDELGRTEELLRLLDPPCSVKEIVKFIFILLDAERMDEAMSKLEEFRNKLDRTTANLLEEQIEVRRMMG